MPLPKPKEGETEKEFIARCMADDIMNEEHPDEEERAGICYSQWRNKSLNQIKNIINEIKALDLS